MGFMTIDGRRVEFTDEPNILTVIRKAGIEIDLGNPPERPEGENGMTPPEKPADDSGMTPPEGMQGAQDMTPPERTAIGSSNTSSNT